MNTKKSKNILVDTNLLVRFFTNDNEQQAQKVKYLLKSLRTNELHIPDLIIAETIFVLQSFYKILKQEIIEKILILINSEKIDTNEKLLTKTLKTWQDNNISFVDAYLCSLAKSKKYKSLYTFDKRIIMICKDKARTP